MQNEVCELVVHGTRLAVQGRWVKFARLVDEWHDDVCDPEALAKGIREANTRADIFTFWQRLPSCDPKYSYYRESEELAVLPVSTYEHWLKRQINNKTRNLVLKAAKKGVVVEKAPFDDEFVHGMVNIFNESPIRQGKPFWHYGKDFDTVKREFSRYLFREQVIGAYFDGELIGFIFLVQAGEFAMLGQIISMIRHRDKAPNNALIAKAVELCAAQGTRSLVYAFWPRAGSLRDFKRHNAFERVAVPRYFLPLTSRGRLALQLKLHVPLADRLPERLVLSVQRFRARSAERRSRDVRLDQTV